MHIRNFRKNIENITVELMIFYTIPSQSFPILPKDQQLLMKWYQPAGTNEKNSFIDKSSSYKLSCKSMKYDSCMLLIINIGI